MNEFLKGILEGINSVIGNYGWSIVVFTFLIRLIIVPFDYKSRLGMRKTAKIQPKINALQKKYANDRDKLNIKMNELYRKEKINPLSSCLPMLLTMPILFAMFAAMRMVANENVVTQVMDVLQHGKQPVMEGWLWIKNIWMPDSPFAGSLPNLDMLRQVTGDIWAKMITGPDLEWLISTLNLPADPFSGANLNATITAINSALLQTGVYTGSGVVPGWTFNLLITSVSIMKDWNGLFLLPIAAAASQLLMTKLQPGAAPQTDANGNAANPSAFMTWFFPLFSLWICSSSNGAFSLYWVAANLFAMIETFCINKYLDMKEAKESNIVEEGGIK